MSTSSRAQIGLIALCTLGTAMAPRGEVGLAADPATLQGTQLAWADAPADEDPRAQADDLIRRAREAMRDGDWEIADSLISRAEALNPRYGLLHTGDTPKKARRDLDRQRKKKGASAVAKTAKPSERFQPNANLEGEAAAPEKPEAASASTPPSGAEAPAGQRVSLGDPKVTARRYLVKGRTELSRANIAGATHWYRKAAEQGANFAPDEDSPEKLLADIQQAGGQVSPAAAPQRPAEGPPAPPPTAPEVIPASGREPAAVTEADNPFGRPLPSVPPASDELEPALRALRQPRNTSTTSTPRPTDGASDQAARMLLEARQALAQGNDRRTMEVLRQVQTMQVDYAPADDSPTKVEAALRRHRELINLRAQQGDSESYRRRYAEFLMEQATWLMQARDLDAAERLAGQAQGLGLEYGPFDTRPEVLLDRIAATRQSGRAAPSTPNPLPQLRPQDAPQPLPPPEQSATSPTAVQADYEPQRQAQPVRPAQALEAAPVTTPVAPDAESEPAQEPARLPETSPPTAEPPSQASSPSLPGPILFRQGNQALANNEMQKALGLFRRAQQYRDQLDAETQRMLDEHLQRLDNGEPAPATASPAPGSLLPQANDAQQLAARQLAGEIAGRERMAQEMRERDPQQALKLLQESQTLVESKQIDPASKEVLLRRVARSIAEMEQYLQENRSRLDLEANNQAVRGQRDRERQLKVEIDQKLAKLIDEHNQLMEEQRYAEAEVLARKAKELAPNNPIAAQLQWQSKFVRRLRQQQAIQDEKENAVVETLASVDRSSVPFNDSDPFRFDLKRWDQVKNRKGFKSGDNPPRSPKEIEIEQKLKNTSVSVQFQERPLAEVIEYLAKLAQVNVHLDPAGLAEEGITTDQPVTINVEDISLRSALKIILEELHLSYVIEDEVLKVTSEQLRSGKVIQQIYYVADLVVPIPNFVPNSRMGLAGALHDAHGALGWNGGGVASPQAVLATQDGSPNNGAVINPAIMANVANQTGLGSPNAGPQPVGFGPGGLGGGTVADFDSLIELITSTVQPETWDEVGGQGTIQPYETNLSLVISQTQEVHEEVAQLLEQLRRLQDLQVTIEVRFITLNDNFFERIGVDFDFNVDDGLTELRNEVNTNAGANAVNRDRYLRNNVNGVTLGLQPTGTFNSDLDIQVRQNNFQLGVPQFGGFDPAAGLQFGFAILSDLEAFFLINAAQGDRRSNVLQAPKVTLFNGQIASVADQSQVPFVVSVIPVVGDFAAAQQPVVVVLNEGTFLSVQAVVTSDRRFVRLTIVPFFSRIDAVNTFTFAGSSTTVTNDTSAGPTDNTTSRQNQKTVTSEGTTVQLPTFSFVSVSTTVSVPDGGTVLLGGIKRLSEGRNEFGVPMLNKLPYVNRLFKNVGIGRETQSLMLMVTPRIIIQEEEEELILGQPQTP